MSSLKAFLTGVTEAVFHRISGLKRKNQDIKAVSESPAAAVAMPTTDDDDSPPPAKRAKTERISSRANTCSAKRRSPKMPRPVDASTQLLKEINVSESSPNRLSPKAPSSLSKLRIDPKVLRNTTRSNEELAFEMDDSDPAAAGASLQRTAAKYSNTQANALENRNRSKKRKARSDVDSSHAPPAPDVANVKRQKTWPSSNRRLLIPTRASKLRRPNLSGRYGLLDGDEREERQVTGDYRGPSDNVKPLISGQSNHTEGGHPVFTVSTFSTIPGKRLEHTALLSETSQEESTARSSRQLETTKDVQPKTSFISFQVHPSLYQWSRTSFSMDQDNSTRSTSSPASLWAWNGKGAASQHSVAKGSHFVSQRNAVVVEDDACERVRRYRLEQPTREELTAQIEEIRHEQFQRIRLHPGQQKLFKVVKLGLLWEGELADILRAYQRGELRESERGPQIDFKVQGERREKLRDLLRITERSTHIPSAPPFSTRLQTDTKHSGPKAQYKLPAELESVARAQATIDHWSQKAFISRHDAAQLVLWPRLLARLDPLLQQNPQCLETLITLYCVTFTNGRNDEAGFIRGLLCLETLDLVSYEMLMDDEFLLRRFFIAIEVKAWERLCGSLLEQNSAFRSACCEAFLEASRMAGGVGYPYQEALRYALANVTFPEPRLAQCVAQVPSVFAAFEATLCIAASREFELCLEKDRLVQFHRQLQAQKLTMEIGQPILHGGPLDVNGPTSLTQVAPLHSDARPTVASILSVDAQSINVTAAKVTPTVPQMSFNHVPPNGILLGPVNTPLDPSSYQLSTFLDPALAPSMSTPDCTETQPFASQEGAEVPHAVASAMCVLDESQPSNLPSGHAPVASSDSNDLAKTVPMGSTTLPESKSANSPSIPVQEKPQDNPVQVGQVPPNHVQGVSEVSANAEARTSFKESLNLGPGIPAQKPQITVSDQSSAAGPLQGGHDNLASSDSGQEPQPQTDSVFKNIQPKQHVAEASTVEEEHDPPSKTLHRARPSEIEIPIQPTSSVQIEVSSLSSEPIQDPKTLLQLEEVPESMPDVPPQKTLRSDGSENILTDRSEGSVDQLEADQEKSNQTLKVGDEKQQSFADTAEPSEPEQGGSLVVKQVGYGKGVAESELVRGAAAASETEKLDTSTQSQVQDEPEPLVGGVLGEIEVRTSEVIETVQGAQGIEATITKATETEDITMPDHEAESPHTKGDQGRNTSADMSEEYLEEGVAIAKNDAAVKDATETPSSTQPGAVVATHTTTPSQVGEDTNSSQKATSRSHARFSFTPNLDADETRKERSVLSYQRMPASDPEKPSVTPYKDDISPRLKIHGPIPEVDVPNTEEREVHLEAQPSEEKHAYLLSPKSDSKVVEERKITTSPQEPTITMELSKEGGPAAESSQDIDVTEDGTEERILEAAKEADDVTKTPDGAAGSLELDEAPQAIPEIHMSPEMHSEPSELHSGRSQSTGEMRAQKAATEEGRFTMSTSLSGGDAGRSESIAFSKGGMVRPEETADSTSQPDERLLSGTADESDMDMDTDAHPHPGMTRDDRAEKPDSHDHIVPSVVPINLGGTPELGKDESMAEKKTETGIDANSQAHAEPTEMLLNDVVMTEIGMVDGSTPEHQEANRQSSKNRPQATPTKLSSQPAQVQAATKPAPQDPYNALLAKLGLLSVGSPFPEQLRDDTRRAATASAVPFQAGVSMKGSTDRPAVVRPAPSALGIPPTQVQRQSWEGRAMYLGSTGPPKKPLSEKGKEKEIAERRKRIEKEAEIKALIAQVSGKADPEANNVVGGRKA